VTIRRSKTDQEGQGATIAICKGSVACPVATVKAWLEVAQIIDGAVFRRVRKGGMVGGRLTDQSVAHIVKAHAERVGLDPALFAGHGLPDERCGQGGLDLQDDGREPHKSVDILRGYVHDAELFRDHAGIGLL
jgi:hypothetical protein